MSSTLCQVQCVLSLISAVYKVFVTQTKFECVCPTTWCRPPVPDLITTHSVVPEKIYVKCLIPVCVNFVCPCRVCIKA
jgi:hypothetical protein